MDTANTNSINIHEPSRMTPAEVAKILGVNENSVKSWLKMKIVPWGFAVTYEGRTQPSYIVLRPAFYRWLEHGDTKVISQVLIERKDFDTLAKAIIQSN